MKNLVIRLRNNRFFSQVFHTIGYCVTTELEDCQSVLDIGCGPSSLIKDCKQITYSVGVEAFDGYLNESKKKKIHTKYIKGEIQNLDFPKKSFDAVIMIEVLEHLSKKDGLETLKRAEQWAKKKIIITTPNGYFKMDEIDKNKFQEHLSGWTRKELEKKGYTCHGVTGAKFMYTSENHNHHMDVGYTFANMRFSPKPLSFVVNAFLQMFVYYIPDMAFELYAVKKLRV